MFLFYFLINIPVPLTVEGLMRRDSSVYRAEAQAGLGNVRTNTELGVPVSHDSRYL
jgi:hypothetical protein